ncbi:MAG: hypothetical protein ACJ0Q7_01005 [Pelagibacteraceae bacterium]|jgi:hypothetical protein
MKNLFLDLTLKLSDKIYTWAHLRRYSKNKKFCACASKELVNFNKKFSRNEKFIN